MIPQILKSENGINCLYHIPENCTIRVEFGAWYYIGDKLHPFPKKHTLMTKDIANKNLAGGFFL